jgi:hypothetical protein
MEACETQFSELMRQREAKKKKATRQLVVAGQGVNLNEKLVTRRY